MADILECASAVRQRDPEQEWCVQCSGSGSGSLRWATGDRAGALRLAPRGKDVVLGPCAGSETLWLTNRCRGTAAAGVAGSAPGAASRCRMQDCSLVTHC
jgi:hypothetical protein